MTTEPTYSKETPCKGFFYKPCGRPGRAWINEVGDTEMRCKLHHPEEQERRRIARGPTKDDRRRDAERRLYAQAALVPEMVAALTASQVVLHSVDCVQYGLKEDEHYLLCAQLLDILAKVKAVMP